MNSDPLLVIRSVSRRFGGVRALDGVDLDVVPGLVHAIIGPNGSGKTTLLNALSGAYRPDSGSIRLGGTELVGLRPNRIAALGLARTFQNIRLFTNLSVIDNVKVAAARLVPTRLIDVLLGTGRQKQAERDMTDRAQEALAAVGLDRRANDPAKSLPYAQQRLLEIARAIVAKPRLLLLDEPAAGMNMSEALTVLETIAKLRQRGLTILLVEHNMRLVMGISDRIVALDFGKKIAEGAPSEIQKHPAVIEAYLGRRRKHA